MLSALADRITGHPERTLIVVILFVVLAGVFGGPVALAAFPRRLERLTARRGARRLRRAGDAAS